MSFNHHNQDNENTLETLCKCRNLLLSKSESNNELKRVVPSFTGNVACDNEFLIGILHKLNMAKQHLTPVIDEIIVNASKLTDDDFSNLKECNEPICSVTTTQFAGAIKASQLLYEVNEHLNEVEKFGKGPKMNTDFTVSTLQYPDNVLNSKSVICADRICIDKELMQQLIELHELLGDTIRRLKVGPSPKASTPVTPDSKPSKKGSSCSSCTGKSKSSSKSRSPKRRRSSTSSLRRGSRGSRGSLKKRGSRGSLKKRGSRGSLKKRGSRGSLKKRGSRGSLNRGSNTSLKRNSNVSIQEYCSKTSVQDNSRTSITSKGRKRRRRSSSKTKIRSKESSQCHLPADPNIKCDTSRCSDPKRCPNLGEPAQKAGCCCKQTKAQKDAKKWEKQRKKALKKQEKERKKAEKQRQKDAKKSGKKCKSKCLSRGGSKSATYIRDGGNAKVKSIDEAKKTIMECLTELSQVRELLKGKDEVDLNKQLEITGNLEPKAKCCGKGRKPHLHAQLNGIPVILTLNKKTMRTILGKSGPQPRKSDLDLDYSAIKCKCGPVALESCAPIKQNREDLDYEPTSDKSMRRTSSVRSTTSTKTKSLPNVASTSVITKTSTHTVEKSPTPSSSVLWKHPELINEICEKTFGSDHGGDINTPETSITVFSTKRTKDGQKIRLCLTIQPVGKGGESQACVCKEERVSINSCKSKQPSSFVAKMSSSTRNRDIIPERDPSTKSVGSKHDGFETDESDPGVPYMADRVSLPDFNSHDEMIKTTLAKTGICHPNSRVQRKLQELGLENLLRVCRPAKCCRRTVINEKPRKALPYPASLMSLPLDEADCDNIRECLKNDASNATHTQFNAYTDCHFKFERYTTFQRDDKFPWKIPTVEVRFFEFFRTETVHKHRGRPICKNTQQTNYTEFRAPRKASPERTFRSWLPAYDFNARFLDVLRKKYNKNASTQTHCKHICNQTQASRGTHSKDEKPHDRKRYSKNLTEKYKNSRHKHNRKINEIPEKDLTTPRSHNQLACFNVHDTSSRKGVRFENLDDLVNDVCSPHKIFYFSDDDLPKIDGGQQLDSGDKALNPGNKCNKDMVKLVPLQPFLIEKVAENQKLQRHISFNDSNTCSTTSSLHNKESRIIYKKCKSGDNNFFLTPNEKMVFKEEKQGFGDNTHRNQVFYPLKPSVVTAYHNTSPKYSNNEKTTRCNRDRSNSSRQCNCDSRTSVHSPASLANLYMDGIIPCYCSKCSLRHDNNNKDTDSNCADRNYMDSISKMHLSAEHSNTRSNTYEDSDKKSRRSKSNDSKEFTHNRNVSKLSLDKKNKKTLVKSSLPNASVANKGLQKESHISNKCMMHSGSSKSISGDHESCDIDLDEPKGSVSKSTSVDSRKTRKSKSLRDESIEAKEHINHATSVSAHRNKEPIRRDECTEAKEHASKTTSIDSQKSKSRSSTSSEVSKVKDKSTLKQSIDNNLQYSSKHSLTVERCEDASKNKGATKTGLSRENSSAISTKEKLQVDKSASTATKKSKISFNHSQMDINKRRSLNSDDYDSSRRYGRLLRTDGSSDTMKKPSSNIVGNISENRNVLCDIPETNIPIIFNTHQHETKDFRVGVMANSSFDKLIMEPAIGDKYESAENAKSTHNHDNAATKLHSDAENHCKRNSISAEGSYYTRSPSFYTPIKQISTKTSTPTSKVPRTPLKSRSDAGKSILQTKKSPNKLQTSKIKGKDDSSSLEHMLPFADSSAIDKGIKESVSDFSKMLMTMNDSNSQGLSIDQNRDSGQLGKYVKHTFSAYNAQIDGQQRPGYISVLQPTCGCPEITVFIPCYCDDDTVLGKKTKPPKTKIPVHTNK